MPKNVFIVILFATLFLGCSYLKPKKTRPSPITKKEDLSYQIKTTVDCDNEDRLRSLKILLKGMGISGEEIEIAEFEHATNVVLEVKGTSDETIVVGAHYDKTTRGCGVIDNWTGIVMLANLYKEFKERDNQKTYKFVAFGKEEKGLHGSKAMVESIPNSKRTNYCGMVNFDSFGFTDLWALKTISDQKLINLAIEIGVENGFTFEIRDYKKASSDSESFQDAKIPSITLSGLGDDWRTYLHKDTDQLENIDFDKVFENFQFAYDYLDEMNSRPCEYFR